MACFDPIIAAPFGDCSPEQRQTICLSYCQRWHPAYWRTTLDAEAYRRCLDDCTGLAPTAGMDTPAWPEQLIAAVGQDLQGAARSVQVPLALGAIIAVAAAIVVLKLT